MSMLNTHGFMPASASASGSGTAVSISTQAHGFAANALLGLGIALLVLTAVFALVAIRGLLPRHVRRASRPSQTSHLSDHVNHESLLEQAESA